MYVREMAWNRKGNNLVGEASIETRVGLALAVCCWVRTEEYYKTRSASRARTLNPWPEDKDQPIYPTEMSQGGQTTP